ncbi:hypothetical protein AAHA92_12624 [Salvia divinorum]|uniref:Uncharacterized protein n=1 Tax=Salvia divinorum TaxID=28513 RepID=A0ABD1HQ02_SALDI
MRRSIWYVAIIASLVASPTETCVKIEQVATGRSVESKPEWRVSVTNGCRCRCPITLLKLMCPKFISTIRVKPPLISIDPDGHCLLTTKIYPAKSIFFTYAWDPIQFQLLYSNQTCS